MPERKLIWLRAETFIHVGVGQQASVVDQPFAREGATGYPYIPGSGVKGALRDAYWLAARGDSPWPADSKKMEEDKVDLTRELFGKQDDSGKILFSDARLAFLPVRTLGGTYRYVTSGGLLRRLLRDDAFVGKQWSEDLPAGPDLDTDFIGRPAATGQVFLEEFPFKLKAEHKFKSLPHLYDGETLDAVNERLAILHDDAFDYFARHGLFVRQRNALDAATKTAKGTALWSEESLPPDTLMYVVLTPRVPKRDREALSTLLSVVGEKYFQVGGNETVGEGWFKLLKEAPQ